MKEEKGRNVKDLCAVISVCFFFQYSGERLAESESVLLKKIFPAIYDETLLLSGQKNLNRSLLNYRIFCPFANMFYRCYVFFFCLFVFL